MNKISKYINEHIEGNVYDKPSILEAFSTDRSVMKVMPRFVAAPSSTADIRQLLKVVSKFAEHGLKLPVAVRGSGYSKTGADLSEGIVISLENLGSILEIDEGARMVRVQAGATLGQVNAVLAAYNLTIPVDAEDGETIHDLISGFTFDNLSRKYHSIYSYVDSIEVALGSGEVLQTGALSPRMVKRKSEEISFVGNIYAIVAEVCEKNFDILDDIRKGPRDFAGYRNIARVYNEGRNMDLLPLFIGSDGTLGVITEVVLRAEPILREFKHVLVAFSSVDQMLVFWDALKAEEPAAVNFFDSNVVRIAAENGKTSGIVTPLDKGYYIVAKFDDAKIKLGLKWKKLAEMSSRCASLVLEDATNTEGFSSLEFMLAQFLNDAAGERPAILDDVTVPETNLSAFLGELRLMEETYGREIPVFGSLSAGLISARPTFNLADVMERQKLAQFMRSLVSLVREHHGSITGGASEGRVKGPFSNAIMKKEEMEMYQALKQAFDPQGILNPEAKIGASFEDLAHHIRTTNASGITTE